MKTKASSAGSMQNGSLAGYRATVAPHAIQPPAGLWRWFKWRAAAPRTVWNFEAEPLSKAG